MTDLIALEDDMLPKQPIAEDSVPLEQSIQETKCTRCGRDNHTVAKCYAKTDVSGKKLDTTTSTKGKLTKTNQKYIRIKRGDKWFSIPNKNYVTHKTYQQPSSDYGMMNFITTCTIL